MSSIRFASSLFISLLLATGAPAVAQTGAVRGYPAGTALYTNPYYTQYYAAQFGYAFPPAANSGLTYRPEAAYPPPTMTPRAAYYAPAYSAPAVAAQPTANYALSPAGGVSAGSEAFAYYGQPAPLNYVPPTYYGYQARMVQVPVTYYRPYTVYQPGAAVPVTCQRAVTTTTCQPQRSWCGRFWDWLLHRNRCGSACGAPPPTTTYCVPATVAPAPCGTPYYNTVPPATVYPGTVVPGTVVPGTVAPSTIVPRTIGPSTTVPAPGTRIITPGSGADIRPALPPGTSVPSGSLGPLPGSGSSLPRSNNYAGSGDSSNGSVSAYKPSGTPIRTETSDRSSQARSAYDGPTLTRPTISEPTLGPRRSVQPVPDPAGGRRTAPANRAPQLLNPDDRTAAAVAPRRGDLTWGVVPATWPEKSAGRTADHADELRPLSRKAPAPREEQWDSSGWKSAAR